MKKLKTGYKAIKRECNLCKAGFQAWLSSLNYDNNKEEAMRERIHNYCPICLVSERNRR